MRRVSWLKLLLSTNPVRSYWNYPTFSSLKMITDFCVSADRGRNIMLSSADSPCLIFSVGVRLKKEIICLLLSLIISILNYASCEKLLVTLTGNSVCS